MAFQSGFRVNVELAARVGEDKVVSLHPSTDHRGLFFLVAGTKGRRWVASGYGSRDEAVKFCKAQGWLLSADPIASKSTVYLPLEAGGTLTLRQAAAAERRAQA